MRKKELFYCFALILIIHVEILPASSFAQTNNCMIKPLVKRGDVSSDGGIFLNNDSDSVNIIGAHALNNRGEVSIFVDVTGACPGIFRTSGLYIVSEERNSLLVNDCRQTSLEKLRYAGLGNINNLGQTAFGAAVFNNSGVQTIGLVFYSQGQFFKITANDDPTPVDTFFRGCGFSEPSLNDKGEVVFGACNDDGKGKYSDGIFKYFNGEIHGEILTPTPSPLGGQLYLNFTPAVEALINNKSEILFVAGAIIGPFIKEKFGWFVKTSDGIKKVFIDGDPLPEGLFIELGTLGTSDFNDKSDVAFSVRLSGKADTGIFVRSGEIINKIMLEGAPTPVGGKFSSLDDPDLIERFLLGRPRINNNGAVAFKAKVIDGSVGKAIFLASPKAMVKVIAEGDELPTGETVKLLGSFALNDLGQIAFCAYKRKDFESPLGVFMATPVAPEVKKIKLKRKGGVLELRITGNGFITNDTTIEINGVTLEAMSYSEEAREDGCTTRQIISRDARLEQLLTPGQAAQIKVFNSLTNRRSDEKAFTRQ